MWGYPEPGYPDRPLNPDPTKKKCEARIFWKCNHDTNFTDKELEIVRQYLNYTFTQLADVKPDKPLCDKILVRQDWKCLTKSQKDRVANTWKQLYADGTIQYLSDLHQKWWPSWHKSPEFLASHRWSNNQLEKAMRSIDPTVTMPYSFPWTYGCQAERASIWDYLGTHGNYSNGYCVTDGKIYPNNLIPCLKREWSFRGTIYPMITPEFATHYLQNAKSFTQLFILANSLHFQQHLNCGGYPGQYSVKNAPYE